MPAVGRQMKCPFHSAVAPFLLVGLEPAVLPSRQAQLNYRCSSCEP